MEVDRYKDQIDKWFVGIPLEEAKRLAHELILHLEHIRSFKAQKLSDWRFYE